MIIGNRKEEDKPIKMPPVKPLYKGLALFGTGLLLMFIGGSAVTLIIGLALLIWGWILMLPDMWRLYKRFEATKQADKELQHKIKPIVVPPRPEDVVARVRYETYWDEKRQQWVRRVA